MFIDGVDGCVDATTDRIGTRIRDSSQRLVRREIVAAAKDGDHIGILRDITDALIKCSVDILPTHIACTADTEVHSLNACLFGNIIEVVLRGTAIAFRQAVTKAHPCAAKPLRFHADKIATSHRLDAATLHAVDAGNPNRSCSCRRSHNPILNLAISIARVVFAPTRFPFTS